jgi:nucleotide-binding universal stress UspA family protein
MQEGRASMLQMIVVPLDGSSRAEQAILVAARLAHATGGTLVFVEVANPYAAYAPYMMAPAPPDTSYDDAMAYLRSVTLRPEVENLSVVTEVRTGSTAEAILTAAREHQAALVVMSSHGRSGLTRWVLGSVAQKVARHADIPVLILRGESPALLAPATEGAPRQVLVPLDGSALSEAALQPAVALAAALDGLVSVRLLRVISLPVAHAFPGGLPPIEEIEVTAREEVRRDADSYLATVAERLCALAPAGEAITVERRVVFAADVAAAIGEIAEGRGAALHHSAGAPAALIAMATHGRGGLARWAMGSITERVLHGTTLPMLVVRPQAVARGEAERATPEDLASALPRTAPLHH